MSEVKKIVVSGVEVKEGSKTAEMLRLNSEGKSVGEIAKELGVKYQMVYNTLKMKGVEVNKVVKEEGESKSSRIRKMDKEGMSKGDIAKELGISYQFVYNVLSRK